MLTLGNLTLQNISEYINDFYGDKCCPFCGVQDTMSVMSSKDNKLVFSELTPLNMFGEKYPDLQVLALIPILCFNCGYTVNLASHTVLNYLNAGKKLYNEQ